jgi:hypothetical protein
MTTLSRSLKREHNRVYREVGLNNDLVEDKSNNQLNSLDISQSLPTRNQCNSEQTDSGKV